MRNAPRNASYILSNAFPGTQSTAVFSGITFGQKQAGKNWAIFGPLNGHSVNASAKKSIQQGNGLAGASRSDFGGFPVKTWIMLPLLFLFCGCTVIADSLFVNLANYKDSAPHSSLLLREAHLGDLMNPYFGKFGIDCFLDNSKGKIRECQLWISGNRYPIHEISRVQIQTGESANSLVSYDSVEAEHDSITLSYYYKGDSIVDADTVFPTGKFIPQKSPGLFAFRIQDGFGSYDDLELDFRHFLKLLSFSAGDSGQVEVSFAKGIFSVETFFADTTSDLDSLDSAVTVTTDSSFSIPDLGEGFDGKVAVFTLKAPADSYTSLNYSDWDFFFDRTKMVLYLTSSKYYIPSGEELGINDRQWAVGIGE